jgi:cold shock CspA family protein
MLDKQKIAIGTLLFFDYKKKNFGFINNCTTLSGEKIPQVYVHKTGLSTSITLSDNTRLIFEIEKSQKGFLASNVKSIREFKLNDVLSFIDLLSPNDIDAIIHNEVGYNYEDISISSWEVLYSIIIKNIDVEAWKKLIRLKADITYIDDFIDRGISALPDEEKIIFLKASYSDYLLEHIVSDWDSDDKEIIWSLVSLIPNTLDRKSNWIPYFAPWVLGQDWTYKESITLYLKLGIESFRKRTLSAFSFGSYEALYDLKRLNEVKELSKEEIKRLKEILWEEKDILSVNSVLAVNSNLSQFSLLQEEIDLVCFFQNKKMSLDELKQVIRILPSDFDVLSLGESFANDIANLGINDFVEVLNLTANRLTLSKYLIEVFLKIPEKIEESSYKVLRLFVDKQSQIELKILFVDLYLVNPLFGVDLFLLELTLKIEYLSGQQSIYGLLKITSEAELNSLIGIYKKYELSTSVLNLNKELSDYVDFILSFDGSVVNLNNLRYLYSASFQIELFTVKFLIYQVYLNKLSHQDFLSVMERHDWSELSVISLRFFLRISSLDRKAILSDLNDLFRSHFNSLSIISNTNEYFYSKFGLNNVLPMCNGRKKIEGRIWNGNGETRYYVKDGGYYHNAGIIHCYCEGKPWKEEFLWDSSTNRPFPEKQKYYWCKGGYCVKRNDEVDFTLNFHNWTLNEITSVLNINMETSILSLFAGWANRINRIVERLVCRSCNGVLSPVPFQAKMLGVNSVPIFKCVNELCDNNSVVRFTHCLNSKCDSHKTSEPLDSRECVSCNPNDQSHIGMQCKYCGSSCPQCTGREPVVVKNNW